MTPFDWQAAIDRVVQDLLRSAEILEPPVDALQLAARMRVTVAIDRGQPERGRFKRVGGAPSIFLRPEDRPERLQWAAAHELGESVAWRVCEVAGIVGHDLPPGRREELANEFAQRLLLPAPWFEAECAAGVDLLQLKHQFASASHELIAWRLLSLDVPTVVTICDQGQVVRRRGNRSSPPLGLLPEERDCLDAVRRDRAPCELSADGFRVQAWPIYEDAWKREILRTSCTADLLDL